MKSPESAFQTKEVHKLRRIMDNLTISWAPNTNSMGFGSGLRENFYVFTIEPHKHNLTGFALYKRKACGREYLRYIGSYYRLISRHETIEDFHNQNNKDTKLAFYFPDKVMTYLENEKNLTKIKIVVQIEANNKFYPTERNADQEAQGLVFKISIDKYEYIDFGENYIPIVFNDMFKNSVCQYWNEEHTVWNSSGIHLKNDISKGCLLYCNSNHLTAFTRIIDLHHMKEVSQCDPVIEDSVVGHITKFCLYLSIIGIIGIFTMAIFFTQWSQRIDVKIFLQLNVATLIQIIAFLINISNDSCNMKKCIAIGSSLQYSIIAQILWMLLYTVYFWMMNHSPAKYSPNSMKENSSFSLTVSIAGWLLPAIPVGLSVLFSRDHYRHTNINLDFCFPTEDFKFWGVVVVIFSILSVNVIFYFLIGMQYIDILIKTRQVNAQKADEGRKAIFWQMIALIFVVGLPWAFGAHHIVYSTDEEYSVWSTYIFCTLVPLQGFLLFLCVYCNRRKYNNSKHQETYVSNIPVRKLVHHRLPAIPEFEEELSFGFSRTEMMTLSSSNHDNLNVIR